MDKIYKIDFSYTHDYSLTSFLDLIYSRSKSEDGKKAYRTGIMRFQEFLETKFTGSLEDFVIYIKENKTEVNIVLRDFVNYLNTKNYRARSVSSYIAAVKKYLRFCGIQIYNEDFNQVVVMPRKMKVQETALTKEILLRLLRNAPPKLQPVILVAVSSGMRIGEIVQLTLEDIDLTSNPTKIRIRAETTKTKTARETFITAEATNALKDYLKRYHGWQENQVNPHLSGKPIFGRALMKSGKLHTNIKQPSILAAKGLLQKSLERTILKIPDLCTKNENGVHTIHFHAFRKFFRTTVGNVCGRDFAEALIGHGFYMDTYYVLSEEQKRELYLKVEPYLTISDFKKVEDNIKTLSANYQKLEKKLTNLFEYLQANSIRVPEPLLKITQNEINFGIS